MISFYQFCENANNKNAPIAEDDNKKIAAIKAGLNQHVKNPEGKTFWDEFLVICGDAENLSHLLGVSKYTIAGWNSKIREYLKIVQDELSNNTKKQRRNMITTGDNADLSMKSNQPEQTASQGDMAGPNIR